MSRHRNVRNLTHDDYYDDDGYYDEYDDYYEEDEGEEDSSYLSKQEKERREREERRKAQGVGRPVVAPAGKGGAGGGGKKGKAAAGGGGVGGGSGKPQHQPQPQPTKTSSEPSASEKEEKVRLLSGMGFSSSDAEESLKCNGWDVRASLDSLLAGGGGGKLGDAGGPAPPPPPGFSRPKADERGKSSSGGGVAPPPPGFSRPPQADERGKKAAAGNEKRSGSVTPPKRSAAGGGGRRGGVSVVSATSAAGTTPRKSASSAASVSPPPPPPPPPPPQPIPPELSKAIRNTRSRLGMVVLGHVDAGKSTLMGQVLLQLGHVEKRTVTKYQKQAAELGKASFALAWVMDEDESERERGVTMDVGTKCAKTPRHDLTILDAPGHADFVPAMIAGAASADVGLLVVAATPGEFESGFDLSSGQRNGGQTREHVVLSRGLGVSQLVVAVNKLDASDPPWSQDRFEYIRGKLTPFLQSSGFNMKRVKFVPVSGLSGINVKDRKKDAKEEEEGENGGGGGSLLSSWYDGPTLLEAMDGFVPAQRNVDKPLRIIVTDVYAEGRGVTAKGRVAQGLLRTGDKIAVLPVGDDATATRIEHGTAAASASSYSPYSYVAAPPSRGERDGGGGGKKEDYPPPSLRANYAMAGDIAEVTLTGIDAARVSPGCVLSPSHPALRPHVAKRVRAKVLVMDELDVPIVRGAQVLLHMHSVDVPASVSKLLSSSKKDGSTRRERPRVVSGGSSAEVEITMTEKICVEEFRVCRSLGRFVLRRKGDTIAVGVIENVLG